MSTKFYIKDNNGIYLSTDGKIRYTLLEGKALYDFLKTENGCITFGRSANGKFLLHHGYLPVNPRKRR